MTVRILCASFHEEKRNDVCRIGVFISRSLNDLIVLVAVRDVEVRAGTLIIMVWRRTEESCLGSGLGFV